MTDITCSRCGGVIAYQFPNGAYLVTYRGLRVEVDVSGATTCGHVPPGQTRPCGAKTRLEAVRVPAGAA